MNKYTYDILSSDGYILLTITSHRYRWSDDAALQSLIPILDTVRKQYNDAGATLELHENL